MRELNRTTSHDVNACGPSERTISNPYIRLLKGGSCLKSGSGDNATPAGRLKAFIRYSPDVLASTFESLEMRADIGDDVRTEIVHAEVACYGGRWLVIVVDDSRSRLVTSGLLRVSAKRIRCEWQVVPSTMLECASNRFATLMTVAEHRDVELCPGDLRLLGTLSSMLRRPEIGDLVRCFGGGERGVAHTMAAVARGYLRLGSRDVLSSGVPVHRGPKLPADGPPFPFRCARPDMGVSRSAA